MRILQIFAVGIMAIVGGISSAFAVPNPDFHIYLCIGQSNMEGNAAVEAVDFQGVPDRFMVMATTDFSEPVRYTGEWYAAKPPLVRENTGLTLMDYFGRTMIDNLPENIKVGVVPVAIGGCRIEHLDKDFDPASLVSEAEWFRNFMHAYDDRPFQRLIACAKKAQKEGVIKGILLHQGESNNGDREWCAKVKKVYDDILAELGLEPESVPLLAGEVVSSEQGGVCGDMNAIIRTLPETLPVAHVISSAELLQRGDGLHFTAQAYRILGCRYAVEMLALMGINNPKVEHSEDTIKNR